MTVDKGDSEFHRRVGDDAREEAKKSTIRENALNNALNNDDLDKFFKHSSVVDFSELGIRELSVFEKSKSEYLEGKFWMRLQYRMHKVKLYMLLAFFSVCHYLVSVLGIQKWSRQIAERIKDVKSRLAPDWLAQVRHRMKELLEGMDEENTGIHKVGEHSGTGHGPPFDPRKFNEAVIAEGGLNKIEQLRKISSGEYFDNHPDSRENKLEKTKVEKEKERSGVPSEEQGHDEDSDTSEDSSSEVDYEFSPNIAIGDHEK